MDPDYFVSRLYHSLDDYIWTNFDLDLEPRIMLEAFLALLALAYTQLLLVRLGFWLEQKPFPYTVLDPFLAVTLPLAALNRCVNFCSVNYGDQRYVLDSFPDQS